MTTVESDINVLKLGQIHISSTIGEMSDQLKIVASDMRQVIALSEQNKIIYQRLDSLEKYKDDRAKATDPVIQRGQTYMSIASSVGTITILIGSAFIAWLVNHVEAAEKNINSHESRIAVLENKPHNFRSTR